MILGRDQGSADLLIDDPGVSRRHARVLRDNGTVIVEDLGSSNGTYVNGHRISGPVELAAGDELQVGDAILGLEGTAATAIMPRQPSPAKRPAPKRLAPHPTEGQSNIPALSAIFLGPLSILLLLTSSGGFFLALPCGIAAIVLGTIGIRNAERKGAGHGALGRLGRITGWVGAILSTLALIAFIVVAVALDATEDSVSGIVDQVRDEINGVSVPDVNSPDVNAPDVTPPENVPDGGSDSGGTSAPD